MKLKKVFGNILIVSILSGCNSIPSEAPTHTPVEIADGFMTEDNNLFIKYNGDNIEVVEGNIYTKYAVDNLPLQLLPISESEYANNGYNFGNMIVDLDNKIINCYINNKVTQHHLSKLDTTLVPGLITYWNKLPAYKEQYPNCDFFPNVEGQILAYDRDNFQIIIPKESSLILVDVEDSFEPISYVQNAGKASQIKIEANRYVRAQNLATPDAIFGTASNKIGIVTDNKVIFIEGG